jgi:bifunctional DNA-binding transcriptional regulator/antitoxin component of YhaV-PrlF toxin-antitoxin module
MIDMRTELVTVSSKFQVVIPQALRERHQIKPGLKMAWVDFGNDLRLVEVKKPQAYRGIARGLRDTDIDNDPEV